MSRAMEEIPRSPMISEMEQAMAGKTLEELRTEFEQLRARVYAMDIPQNFKAINSPKMQGKTRKWNEAKVFQLNIFALQFFLSGDYHKLTADFLVSLAYPRGATSHLSSTTNLRKLAFDKSMHPFLSIGGRWPEAAPIPEKMKGVFNQIPLLEYHFLNRTIQSATLAEIIGEAIQGAKDAEWITKTIVEKGSTNVRIRVSAYSPSIRRNVTQVTAQLKAILSAEALSKLKL